MSELFDWLQARVIGIVQLSVMAAVAWLLFCAGWALINWSDPGLVTLKGVMK